MHNVLQLCTKIHHANALKKHNGRRDAHKGVQAVENMGVHPGRQFGDVARQRLRQQLLEDDLVQGACCVTLGDGVPETSSKKTIARCDVFQSASARLAQTHLGTQ